MNLADVYRDVRRAAIKGASWEADTHLSQSELRRSLPGVVVEAIVSRVSPPHIAFRTVALTCAFAARRSLACWFVYCDDTSPSDTVRRLITAIIEEDRSLIGKADTEPTFPKKGGMPIEDCRQSDTLSASTAVAYAVAYFLTRDDNFAAYSLSYSVGAFEDSPIGSDSYEELFSRWLLEVAIPAAAEGRDMTTDEQEMFIDFSPFLLRR